MGLFSSGSDNATIELYKQKAHLSNDYLQGLTPLIESINENEGRRHEISNQLIQLIEEMKESLSPDMFIKTVGFMEIFAEHSRASKDNHARLISYWTKMGERTKELIDQYGLKANVR